MITRSSVLRVLLPLLALVAATRSDALDAEGTDRRSPPLALSHAMIRFADVHVCVCARR